MTKMNIIGQKNLITKLNTFNIDTFPRSILLLGQKGSGKHLICDYIRDNIINLPLLDITNNISSEVIDQIYRNPNPSIYMIDMSDMLEKNQNILLKFIEEPLNNSFLILLSDNDTTLLNTIKNRCIIFEMDKYSRSELEQYISLNDTGINVDDIDIILNIIKTPGQLNNNSLSRIKDIYTLCDKIINKLSSAGYSNTLTIGNKINYKDDYSKFDLDLFLDTLIYLLYSYYRNNDNSKYFKMYLLTINYRKKLLDKRLNKEQFIENYLTNLWRLSKEYYGY